MGMCTWDERVYLLCVHGKVRITGPDIYICHEMHSISTTSSHRAWVRGGGNGEGANNMGWAGPLNTALVHHEVMVHRSPNHCDVIVMPL